MFQQIELRLLYLLMRYFCLAAIGWLLMSAYPLAGLEKYKKIIISGQAQGTTYQIVYYAIDSSVRKHQVDSILQCIDHSLSLYQPASLINRFNDSETGVVADHHLKTVVRKALETFHHTNGIFDITVQPLVQAWGFGPRKTNEIPDSATLYALQQCVSSNWLRCEGDSLIKLKPCIKIDLNGIAQGYTVDVLSEFLQKNGISNYLVELGGEIRIKGRKLPGKEKMRIGIEAPPESPFAEVSMQKIITPDSGALTTSGSYRKFYESNGKRITHIIDPRTAYPSQNELISVTVYAADAITADAYDNALMVMGLEEALQFAESRNGIAAYFIYRRHNGTVADTASRLFNMLLKH